MNVIIVEDSRLAREGLKSLLLNFPEINVVGEAEDADEGADLLASLSPDVVFLDIDMPGKNGFEMLSELDVSPPVIFTTAFSEYAVRSFDFNTIDYLLKPIDPEKLSRAISKLKDTTNKVVNIEPTLNAESRLFIRDKDINYFVELEGIRRFESCGNYTRLFFGETSPFVYKSLSKVEDRLPKELFFRVSRQQIVNLKFIETLEEGISGAYVITMKGGEEVSVSRNRSSQLRDLFSL